MVRPASESRRNPRRSASKNYSEMAGSESEGTNSSGANPASSSSDEELEDVEEDDVQEVRRSGRTKTTADGKKPAESTSRRTSSRSNKFSQSMTEPSESVRDLFKGVSLTANTKRRGGKQEDPESEESDEEEKPRKRQPRKKPAQKKRLKTPSPKQRRSRRRNDSDDSDEYSSSDDESMNSDESETNDSDDEDPVSIQRILASRTETLSAWKKICERMNTKEVTKGSRWYQEDDDRDPEMLEERFLVKWNGLSYMHCSWESHKDLVALVEGAKTYMTTFFRKSENGVLLTADERCDGDYFNPAFTQVDRILEVVGPEGMGLDQHAVATPSQLGIELESSDEGDAKQAERKAGRLFFVKWSNCPYSECTEETERDLLRCEIDYRDALVDFCQRSKKPDRKEIAKKAKESNEAMRQARKIFVGNGKLSDEEIEAAAKSYQDELEQFVFPNGGQLRDYQAHGVTWMVSNFIKGRSSILADEMGLGKTIQTAAFVDIVATKMKLPGPHLIIAPLSTITHWYREFTAWTKLNTIVYHGSAADRDEIRKLEFPFECDRWHGNVGMNRSYLGKCRAKKGKTLWMPDVVITTPEMLCAPDWKELTEVDWQTLVVDEAHRLKNHTSKLAVNLRDEKFNFKHKVLLTGTPIQNDVKEFWTLLNFIDPSSYGDLDEFLERFGDMKSKERIDELHEDIHPYILRRLKEDVEKSVPPKEETLIEVELTALQKQYYRALYEKNVKFLHKNKKALDGPSLSNLAMQLRKCCNHPFLLNGVEEGIRAQQAKKGELISEGDNLVRVSGKLVLLDKLLPRLKQNGHRVLLFSQFKIMLDILEDYFNARGTSFERIDGSITGAKRQRAIDRFQQSDDDGKEVPFVMLLSTRAGGVGITLTAADTCIIFDSDWNPQNDLQAQARCHRIGQTKSVQVYRLLTRKTYEMQMFHMSSLKMGLDQAVLKGFEGGSSGEGSMTKEEVEKLLRHGAYDIFSEDKAGNSEAESNEFMEQDIDSILERRTRKVVHANTGSQSNAAGGSFSKASFKASRSAGDGNNKNPCEDIDIEDPEFWTKMVGEDNTEDSPGDLAGKRRNRTKANYSEHQYDKSIDLVDSEEENESSSSAEVESSSSDEELDGVEVEKRRSGKGDERGRWGGSGPLAWTPEHVDTLLKRLVSHGYNRKPWDEFLSGLSFVKKRGIEEAKRMCWSLLLLALEEAAHEDAMKIKRKADRIAEKKREEENQSTTTSGGVLGSAANGRASKIEADKRLMTAFKKIWDRESAWAELALRDAVDYARKHPPRQETTIEKFLRLNGTSEQSYSAALLSKFNTSIWPFLELRGWTVSVTKRSGGSVATEYSYRDRKFYEIDDVLAALPTLHGDLEKLAEPVLAAAQAAKEAGVAREKSLRSRHLQLNSENIDPFILDNFLQRYSPLQLLADRKKDTRISFPRRLFSSCRFLHAAKTLVDRAGTMPGQGALIDKLERLLSVESRSGPPHPLWTQRHDAVLVSAIARHGWLENDSSIQKILDDSSIQWGPPFDSTGNTPASGAATARSGDPVNEDQTWQALHTTAKRAVLFLELNRDILDELKGFNVDNISETYGLILRQTLGSENSTRQHCWTVDDASLRAATETFEKHAKETPGGEGDYSTDLPTKKYLIKRAKQVLTKSTNNIESTIQLAERMQVKDKSVADSESRFPLLNQADQHNVLLAEILKGIVKINFSKMEKRTRLLFSFAFEEATRRQQVSDQQASPMKRIAEGIILAQKSLKSTRQAKNVLRQILGLELHEARNSSEGLFPTARQELDVAIASRNADGAAGRKRRSASRTSGDQYFAGERAIVRAMKKVYDKKTGAPGRFQTDARQQGIQLTATETVILRVICSQGIPVWNDNWEQLLLSGADDENRDPCKRFMLMWSGMAGVMEKAADDWHQQALQRVEQQRSTFKRFEEEANETASKSRSREQLLGAERDAKVKHVSVRQLHDYSSNPLKLGQKVIMLLGKIRQQVATTSKKGDNTDSGPGPKVLSWFSKELTRWAGSFEVLGQNGLSHCYVAADFLEDNDPRDEAAVTALLDKKSCRDAISQIALLSRNRSLLLKHNGQLKDKLGIVTSKITAESWERPKWWGNDAGSNTAMSIRHDLLLLENLAEYGFDGVLTSAKGFGPQQSTGHHVSLHDLGVTKACIQARANQLTRELNGLEDTEELLQYLGERGKSSSLSMNAAPSDFVHEPTNNAKERGVQVGLRAYFAASSIASGKKKSVVIISSDTENDIGNFSQLKRSNEFEDLSGSSPEKKLKSAAKTTDVIEILSDSDSDSDDDSTLRQGKRLADHAVEAEPSPEKKFRSS